MTHRTSQPHTQKWVTLRPDAETSDMMAFETTPNSPGPWPAVIVFMEIFGINDHIQDICHRLAQAGFLAIAPDFFHRQVSGLNLGYTDQDVATGRQYKSQVSAQDILKDTQAVIGYLKQHPNCQFDNGIATIGFCFGGHLAFRVAELPEISITASFYGGGIASQPLYHSPPTLEMVDRIRGRMLCFFGGLDPIIPPQDVEAVASALKTANVNHQLHLYPNADHGFLCDRRNSFLAEAAEEAWGKTLHAFDQVLVSAKRAEPSAT